MIVTVYRCEWLDKENGIAGFKEYDTKINDKNILDELQKLVGGFVQLLSLDECDLIINEEGLLLDLPENKWAIENGLRLVGTVVKLHDRLK